MRSLKWARWATYALAISICVPALADHKKSLAACTAFDQVDKGDDGVELSIRNTCKVPVDCTISWRVVCAPSAHKRRSVHPSTTKLAITEGGTQSTDATATVCGDDGWSIDDITWSCEPNME